MGKVKGAILLQRLKQWNVKKKRIQSIY